MEARVLWENGWKEWMEGMGCGWWDGMRGGTNTHFFTAVEKERTKAGSSELQPKMGRRRFRDWALVLLYYCMRLMVNRSWLGVLDLYWFIL